MAYITTADGKIITTADGKYLETSPMKTIQTFPENVIRSFSILTDEEFQTLISGFEGRNEQRSLNLRFPNRIITIPYNQITNTDWPLLHSFFRKRLGGYEPFWFFSNKQRNMVDEYVGRGGPLPLYGAIAEDGGVQTEETDAANNSTVNDMTLVPLVPEAGDCYYFIKSIKFDKVTITIGTQGAGTWTIVWEYPNGSGWQALSGVTDGTSGFMAAAGTYDVTFTMPSDWVETFLKNRWGYPVRARVSSFTSITTQPKGTLATVNTKTYDLPSKSTLNDSTLIAYINDAITSKTFVSGGGGGGADRITLDSYAALGALITAEFTGLLRIRGCLGDKFGDEWHLHNYSKTQITIREERIN